MTAHATTVSLVLGSGGARGLAHIGVIRELEARGYVIRAISGSSMGAVIGGIHALGGLDVYEKWVTGLGQTDVFRMLDWTFSGGGLIRGELLMQRLRDLVGECNIEDLPIDFTAVAVDIERGREVWFSDGSLFEAIRASMAVPSVFTPHAWRGRMLVDGGLLNPVPVAPTLRTLTALTVNVEDEETRALLAEWERHDLPVRLTVLESPYREVTRPIISYLKKLRAENPRDVVSVFIPEYVVGHWWEHLLHNQSALRLKGRLLFLPGVMVTSV